MGLWWREGRWFGVGGLGCVGLGTICDLGFGTIGGELVVRGVGG